LWDLGATAVERGSLRCHEDSFTFAVAYPEDSRVSLVPQCMEVGHGIADAIGSDKARGPDSVPHPHTLIHDVPPHTNIHVSSLS